MSSPDSVEYIDRSRKTTKKREEDKMRGEGREMGEFGVSSSCNAQEST